jgi:hypothetical protein
LESHLTEVAGDSHITQITCAGDQRVQTAQLDRQSNRVTFEPMEAVDVPGSSAGDGVTDSSFKAFTVNETGVMVLLCLFLLAAFPPIFFCELVRRRRAVPSRAASFISVRQATH